MPDNNDNDPNIESMLEAAFGGLTAREALIRASQAEAADPEARAEAIARNRQRALQLLAALEKSQG